MAISDFVFFPLCVHRYLSIPSHDVDAVYYSITRLSPLSRHSDSTAYAFKDKWPLFLFIATSDSISHADLQVRHSSDMTSVFDIDCVASYYTTHALLLMPSKSCIFQTPIPRLRAHKKVQEQVTWRMRRRSVWLQQKLLPSP